ncbi:MAG: HAMP domain-containing histidine kinase [Clostridia bacterium]|nr:HAMP domain-containing histidine kinase [Clostridia bacterium]
MLKKLKLKFILTNMLLVGIVVLFIFSAVCVMTYRSQTEEMERALEDAVFSRGKNDLHFGGIPLPPFEEKKKEEDYLLPAVYTFPVLVDFDGNLLVTYDGELEMDEDFLIESIRSAVSAEEDRGILSSQNLMYLRKPTTLGYMIAFASTEHLQNTMRNTVLISAAACFASLLLFLLVSIGLSELAIRPAREAWEKQKRFVADASHDLKTPLTVILANQDILLSHESETIASQKQWLESTEEETKRMRGLVDKLLMLAKSEDMKERMTFHEVNVSELCEQVALQFEAVAFEREIMIESKIAQNIIRKTDAEAFERLLHILLDNALKYSPRGESVQIVLEPVRRTLILSVRNGGEVIPKETLSHLFERFYRADQARTVGGFGLGLSIAKNLAEGLHASISVSSDAEKGTVFTVCFK